MRAGGRLTRPGPRRLATVLAGAMCAAGITLAPGALATTAPTKASTAVTAFGRVPCVPTEGVLFCQGSVPVTPLPTPCGPPPVPCDGQVYNPTVPDTRVPSWDGTPLDTNLVLPLGDQHNLPLIISIPGYPSQKVPLDVVGQYGGLTPRAWALKGYAVLSYSSRGQFGSCGWPASRVNQPACLTGWQRLDSMAYEAHDTQWLASLLADQGIVNPTRIGVTGSSWGAGQSVELATLHDRVMLPDGTLVPWVSPGPRHLHMSFAAAAPMAAWSDLIPPVLPNGHDLDYTLTPAGQDTNPLGVTKASVLQGLYAELAADSYAPPPGGDPPLTESTVISDAGWPALSPANPLYAPAVADLHRFHSPYYLLDSSDVPAATLWENGWNDDIFPVTEELRWVNKVLSAHPGAQVSVFLSDIGHPRSLNKAADSAALTQAVVDWFAHYLLGDGTPVLRGVEVLTTTCPATSPSGGPYFAPSWPAVHPGEVRERSAGAQTVISTSGDPQVDTQIDPIAGPGVCASPSPSSMTHGTATYSFAVPAGGFTMIGAATVVADMEATSVPGAPLPYVSAHLFDVAPGGTSETLVARQTYRLSSSGPQVFQLYPQAWFFAPGHTMRLELVGQDAPYSRPDTLPGEITVANLELTLPAAEQPNCTTILSPAPPVVPVGEQLAPGVNADPPDACATTP